MSDRFLTIMASMPSPVGRVVARRAARRGLHVSALRAWPDDPFVLNALGMHLTVLESEPAGEVERAIALASVGRTDEARGCVRDVGGWSAEDRRRLAASAALSDPAWALSLLPEADTSGRAACLLALGDGGQAESLVQTMPDGQEQRFLGVAALMVQQRWCEGRRALNTAFEAEGLASVVDETVDAPVGLDTLLNRARPLAGERPCVSVIIAARNATATIDIALRSLQDQTWRSLDIVVVDDRSTDNTAERVRAVSARDPRVRLLSNTRSAGAYGARNTGAAAAIGDFVAFHDADDWAHPERIARQMTALAPEAAATLCRHVRLDAGGRFVSPRVFPLMRLNPILLLTRREVFEGWGGFEEAKLGADSELLARLDAAVGRRAVVRVSAPCVIAGWSDRSLMGATSTGLSREGLALRTAYVEQWRRRHASDRLRPT